MSYQLHDETLALVKEERRLTGLVIANLQKISIEILAQIENCSKRETEKVLANLSQDFGVKIETKPKETFRELGNDETSVHLRLKSSTIEKLNRLKALRSHKNPRMNYADIIDEMCDQMLKKFDPMLWKPRKSTLEKKSRVKERECLTI